MVETMPRDAVDAFSYATVKGKHEEVFWAGRRGGTAVLCSSQHRKVGRKGWGSALEVWLCEGCSQCRRGAMRSLSGHAALILFILPRDIQTMYAPVCPAVVMCAFGVTLVL